MSTSPPSKAPVPTTQPPSTPQLSPKPPPPPFTFRPCTRSDLPVVAALLNYYISHSLAILTTIPRSLDWWSTHFSLLRSKSLPFILCVTPQPLSSPPLLQLPTSDYLLGYGYASPYVPYPGYSTTAELSLYISPSARLTGVGTALSLFLHLVLKYPTRYPEYGVSDLVGEEKGIRKVVSWMTRDEWGVGKGKERWLFEKLKRETGLEKKIVGVLPGVGRKWGKEVSVVWVWCDLEGWKTRGERGREGEEDLKRLGWAGTVREVKTKAKAKL